MDGKWEKSPMANAWRAISDLLWAKDRDRARAIKSIARVASQQPAMRFRLGVPHRVRSVEVRDLKFERLAAVE